jgi:Polyketide cyclase / dehydrase and lipid transport
MLWFSFGESEERRSRRTQLAATGGECILAKIGASVVVDRPVEVVWRLVIDFPNAPKVDPDLLECKVTSEGPLGVGTTVQSKRTTRGANLVVFHVTEYEPGRKVTAEVMSPNMMKGSRNTTTLENAEGKTKLSVAWDMKLNGFYSLLGPLLARSTKKLCETQVGNMKRILESEPQS